MVISTVISSLDTFIEDWRNSCEDLIYQIEKIQAKTLKELEQILQTEK